jgi:chromosome segregation ATPase
MLSFIRYKKKGLPHVIISNHEFLLNDMITYFEKGKVTRAKIKGARKALKQAVKVARKKKINPGVKINQAREELEQLREEVDYIRKALSATAEEMENAIRRIEEERIGEVLVLMDDARERFRSKDMEGGIELLKQSQVKMESKVLKKSRGMLLGGIHGKVKNLKVELEERRSKAKESKSRG